MEEQIQDIDDIMRIIEQLPVDDFSLQDLIEGKATSAIEAIPENLASLLELVDPTGKISILFSHIERHKTKKEFQRIMCAVAWLVQKTRSFSKLIEPNNEQDIELLMMYLERCKETYQLKKIETYSNIWINSLINRERDVNEKEYIFNLASLLTLEELFVLKFIYNQSYQTSSVSIDQIAENLIIEKDYAQQICIRLQGMGLLYPSNLTILEAGGGRLPTKYSMTNYVRTFVKYITDPNLEQSDRIT